MTSASESPAAIEPDTKDWTWTITQACGDCGFDGTAVPPESVAERLRATIGRWASVLGRPDARTRPEPHVWSPLEYGCHVRDVARIFGERVRLMLDQEDPRFANWDQDETAVAERYWEQDPQRVAAEYDEDASALADLLDSVAGQQWQRPGTRSNGSQFTVASIAVYMLHDIEHHLHDVGA